MIIRYMKILSCFVSVLFYLLLLHVSLVMGGQAPDAGQILQETAPEKHSPHTQKNFEIRPPEISGYPSKGGIIVALKGVKIVGNTVFGEDELIRILGKVNSQTFDFSGLQGLARKITVYYKNKGYPFARALLPSQRLENGILKIRILEGKYGSIETWGEFADTAKKYFSGLKSGDIIKSDILERSTLILDDQPGISIAPVIRPGKEIGTGDLIVNVSRTSLVRGNIVLDNHGNSYTGEYRAMSDIYFDSPFMLGDQIFIRAVLSDGNLCQGSIGYSLPIGAKGLRGSIGYSHTYYEIGREFSALDAHGTAKTASFGISYPIVRSQPANLTAGISYQHKYLEDCQDATSTTAKKESDVLPFVFQFDRRDATGIFWGSIGVTFGYLSLDHTLEEQDAASRMDTRGSFQKLNINIERLQTTPLSSLTVFGQVSAQFAADNLDSSEGFTLGGADGVRAYPQGEGAGDEGWLIQLEARYRFGFIEPYLFYDAGYIRINAEPENIIPAVEDNTRLISGAGIGFRIQKDDIGIDSSVAWQTSGGKPKSDSRDRDPRVWLSFFWNF